MTKSKVPSANAITATEFQEYLSRYPPLLESISETRGAKNGQKTLAELDKYRYGAALETFSSKDARAMEIDDVKDLVEWKLRHGKFRPTLMKLVSSNDSDVVKTTIQDAIKSYRNDAKVRPAIDTLAKLKGIGPATASLLLAVHDPEHIVFFADEAFWWLCCDGKKDTIKYNAKEYQALHEQALSLVKRLGVSADSIERVAFAILREQDGLQPADEKKEHKPAAQVGDAVTPKMAAKRKKNPAAALDSEIQPPIRRSKRVKNA